MGYFLVQTFYLKKLRRTLGVRIFFRFSMAYRAILSKGNKKARFSGLLVSEICLNALVRDVLLSTSNRPVNGQQNDCAQY
jgi:hypothetical protein